jgi:hypothetical protein
LAAEGEGRDEAQQGQGGKTKIEMVSIHDEGDFPNCPQPTSF